MILRVSSQNEKDQSSLLAVKTMLDLQIEMHAITYITPFYMPSRRHIKDIQEAAGKYGISLKFKTFGREYIELIKHPRFGYGKNMNACVDCRILMLKEANRYLEEIGGQFIITGEVLGERPMTQNKKALMLIERESDLSGKIIRPLSAKVLKVTIPEENGLVDREKLFGFQGRSRKAQIELAGSFGIQNYPTPAGGCLLTDLMFSRKLRDAFKHNECSLRQITILRYGRHFRLKGGAKVTVGRNEKENGIILSLSTAEDICMEVETFVGPIALLQDSRSKDDVRIAASICLRYSDCPEEKGNVNYWKDKKKSKSVKVEKIEKKNLDKLRI